MGERHHHPHVSEAEFHHGMVRGSERRRLLLVILLTGTTMVAEFIGAWVTGSVALLADAFHMVTHLLAVGISYVAIRIALRPSAPEKTYRNWRAEILGALFSAVALLPVAAYVIYEAIERTRNPREIEVGLMLVVGVIGLAVNVICAVLLHHHSHDDLNVRGAFLHMVADSASSVGVLAAGGALLIWPSIQWIDPLVGGLISVMILVWAWGLLKQSCSVLLESVPAHISLEELRRSLREVGGVEDVHDIHVWTITSRMHALTAHVRFERDCTLSEAEALGHTLEHLLEERFGINHVTLQFEVNDGTPLHCEHPHEPAATQTPRRS